MPKSNIKPINDVNQRVNEQAVIYDALQILTRRLKQPGQALTSPVDTANYLVLKLTDYSHEVFCCLFLDNRHRVIEFEELFRGTIDGCSVHPREIVKHALSHNAAAVILAHNHPSGVTEPSSVDKSITQRLKDALALIDVRVLDHFIVGGTNYLSFANQGLI